jgi:hypothetical protein
MAAETIEKELNTLEALAGAMLDQCYKTRLLIKQDEVSTSSADQRLPSEGPLSRQELLAISAKRRIRVAKANAK